MIVTVSELRSRDVIRLCDAKNLGCVSDVCIDTQTGCVTALSVLTGTGGFFSGGGETRIPWDKIRCIGEDAILVSVTEEECCPRPKRGKGSL